MSKKAEKLKLLNGKELEFTDDSTLLITSGDVPVGIAGVMGGSGTEVDSSTKNIVLECATFDMYSTRKTSMKYGLFTDAVTRFNKGQSPHQNDKVLAKTFEMIQALAGGQTASRVFDEKGEIVGHKPVKTDAKFINERLGLALENQDIAKLLKNVEFEVALNDSLEITPPYWRTDIEIPEDIVEEVGRLYGYDHLPLVLPKRSISPAKQNERLDFRMKVSKLLASAGANEVLTYNFVHGDLFDKVGQNRDHAFALGNALSPDLQYLRMTLTPSLLEKIHPNIKAGYQEFTVFEINKTHNKLHLGEDDGLPKEFEMLALVTTAGDKQNKSGDAYYQAVQYLEFLAKNLGLILQYTPLSQDTDFPVTKPFNLKKSAIVSDETSGNIIGIVGEYKPSVSTKLKLPKFTAGFEVGIDELFAHASGGTQYQPISRFPYVSQDITLRTPEKVTFGELLKFLESNLEAPKNSTFEIMPLDIFQKQGEKERNLSFRLNIASYERTLTDPEINALLDKLALKAQAKFNVSRV